MLCAEMAAPSTCHRTADPEKNGLPPLCADNLLLAISSQVG